MRDTRGNMPEPEWRACLSVLKCCENGEQIAQEWSAGHPNYSAEETVRKLQRTNGAQHCTTFEGYNDLCMSCPHKGAIHTPLDLGRLPIESKISPEVFTAPVREFELDFDTSPAGRAKPSFNNALVMLYKLKLDCDYDEFLDFHRVESPFLDPILGIELNDPLVSAFRMLCLNRFNKLDPGKINCWDALLHACRERTFNSMRDYFDQLHWDGQARLDTWLIDYAGAQDCPVHQQFGRKFLLAAVRRVRHPGTKFDYMLVLEGDQGIGKSSCLRILAGDAFSDAKIDMTDERQAQEILTGVLIHEFGELASMMNRRTDVETVREFISKTHDKARPAYARSVINRPRQVVLAGTTNPTGTGYLRDRTGNRRFWPVLCTGFDLDGLARDREQIWAEAAYYEATGESLELPKIIKQDVLKAQAARVELDPWCELLSSVTGILHGDEYRVSASTIATTVLGMTPRELNVMVGKRMAEAMRQLGWDGPHIMRVKAFADDPVGVVGRAYRRLVTVEMEK